MGWGWGMYVKRHAVVKGDKRYVYLRLVEAYRQDGRSVIGCFANLGREDELKASGQLDQLAASFARLDPPPWGTRRDVGSLLLVRHYLQRLGLVSWSTTRSRSAAGPSSPTARWSRRWSRTGSRRRRRCTSGRLGVFGGDG